MKTESRRSVQKKQKKVETTIDLIGNQIVDTITSKSNESVDVDKISEYLCKKFFRKYLYPQNNGNKLLMIIDYSNWICKKESQKSYRWFYQNYYKTIRIYGNIETRKVVSVNNKKQ